MTVPKEREVQLGVVHTRDREVDAPLGRVCLFKDVTNPPTSQRGLLSLATRIQVRKLEFTEVSNLLAICPELVKCRFSE